MYEVRYSPHSSYPWQVVDKDQGVVLVLASFSTKRRLRDSTWAKSSKIPPWKEWWGLGKK